MSARLRLLKKEGVAAFRCYLQELRNGSLAPPPNHLLTGGDTSRSVDADIPLENINPGDHYEMASYLIKKLAPVHDIRQPGNASLWSWLSLYFFDLVCPAGKGGARRPGKDYRHIPESNFQHAHRHLLSGPFHLTLQYNDLVRFLLAGPLHKMNNLYHQLYARQNIISNKAIMKAVHILYCNPATGKPKQGSASASSLDEPGCVFRFITVIQQLELTYDLFSMSAEQILSLLPPEFEPWRSRKECDVTT